MFKNLRARFLLLLLCIVSAGLFAQTDNRRCQEDGRISLAFSGDTTLNTCIDDEVMDRLRFQVVPFRQAFAYIVVDANDIVQSVGFSNFINFDMLPAGQLKVYAFSNYGNILVEVGDTFSTTTLSLPCAGITTNCVVINNGSIGDVEITSAQDTYDICLGDGNDDFVEVSSSAISVVYVITDEEGNVLGVNDSGSINFEDAGSGVCRIYALAGGLTIEVGENISILEGVGTCGEGLSEAFITVNRETVNGGIIRTEDGEFETLICPGDGNADIVNFTVEGGEGENSRIVITDESNIIVMLPAASSVDFDPTPVGICRAWNVSYSGAFVGGLGMSISDIIDVNDCISLSGNFVLVTRMIPEAGMITTTEGTTSVETCTGDGVDDIINVIAADAEGGDLVYILTDGNNSVLNISETPSFNLEGAPIGTCFIWAVAYQGNLTVTSGDDITAAVLSDNCFDLSDNFVSVIRSFPAGGTVATIDGETEISLCPNDGVDDFVSFTSTGATGTNFTFIITDDNNVILGVPPGDQANFEGAPLGTCRLWGLSYEGDLQAMMDGDLLVDQLASECYALSDNFVTVVREEPSGGSVGLSNGETSATICPGDGIADVLTFVSTGASGDNFAFVITDESGTILGFPASASIDFDVVPAGICRVYGLSFSGSIIANVDDNINDVQLASSCSTLSDNFVTVIRTEATTGNISTEDGATEVLVCPGDAIPDNVRFDSTGTTLTNFNYLVTDTNNIVLQVAFTDLINFESFPVGTCRVWGLGYDGLVTAQVGQVAGVDQLTTECAALSSNFVTVVKQQPDGGTISTTDGETEVTVCSLDGIPDVVSVVSSSASGARFFFVITTGDNIILNIQDGPDFDFDTAPFGTCKIWGLSFQGTLLAEAGDNVTEVLLAEGCSDLSDNFVTVTREDADGGTISLEGGGDVANTCPGDGNPDIVNFTTEGSSGDVIYLITNDQDTLLATTGDGSFDFDGAGVGTCRVYALSYAGSLLVTAGDEVTTADLADGCFDLSDNYVSVVREVPVGDTISLADGTIETSFCSGDGADDILRFLTNSTSANYGYIIADNGIALTGITTDSFDLSNALSGMFEIYGVAYTGTLTVGPGLDIFNSVLSTDCYDLSENFITVNITRVDGGNILGNGATELYFCPENLDDGLVTFSSSSLISNMNYVYVITTANDAQVILSIIDDDTFDFGALPLMEVRVCAISYTGDLLATPGRSLTFDDIATGCVSISNNCVSIFNDTPEAETVSVNGLSSTGVSCVVDGDVNISVSTTSTSLAGYAAIITDTFGIIQLISTDLDVIPFGDLAEGPYRVYGLSYTGTITAVMGDDIEIAVLADNCYDLTAEFVDIIRGGEITAGELSNETTDGGDTIEFCLLDGDIPIVIVGASVSGLNYRYIITDTDNRVLIPNLQSNIIPFTGFMPGEYRIHGFNFTGQPNVGVNQILTNAVLSTECYALTSNFITVILAAPDAGSVLTDNNETEVTIEIDETSGSPVAEVSFVNSSVGAANYAYVVTDEANSILAVSSSPTINFGPAGVGVCRVWGLSYSGTILAMMGDDAATAELTDGCFDLSDGFVTVTREEADGLGGSGDNDGLPGEEQGDVNVPGPTLTAFPNPSATNEIFVTISSDLPLSEGRISVRDLNGQTYMVQALNGGVADMTVRLDISNLTPGMYFATYVTPHGIQSLQFMKQ